MKSIKANLIAVFLVVLGDLGNYSGLYAGEDGERLYKASGIEGSFLVWQPWTFQWYSLKEGDEVWEGSLIQALGESKVQLKEIKESQSKGFDILLSFSLPMIVRLDHRIMRKINIASFLSSDGAPPENKKDEDPWMPSLADAWSKVGALLSKTKGVEDQLKKFAGMGKSSESMVQDKEVRFLEVGSPKEGTIFYVDKFPSEIAINWEDLNLNGVRYDVFIWPASKERAEPNVKTEEAFYIARIEKEGTFYVQIEAPQAKISSKAIIFYVREFK